MSVSIKGATVLVTGANRGLGRAFALALRDAGAKVYAGARDPSTVTDQGLIPVRLDITDPEQVAEAANRLDDVDLVINNAGIARGGAGLIGSPTVDDARAEMETNFFGTLSVSRAFAPVLKRNGGGALVNVASVLSWITFPSVGSYSASKAALWAATNAIRLELADQNTLVVAVHAAYIDTDMAAGVDGPKTSPESVVEQTLRAIEAGETEVLADELSRTVKAGLSG